MTQYAAILHEILKKHHTLDNWTNSIGQLIVSYITLFHFIYLTNQKIILTKLNNRMLYSIPWLLKLMQVGYTERKMN